MANIRVDSPVALSDGLPLTFKSPADCSQVTGLIVYYPNGEDTSYREFLFADAHGNNIGHLDLFASDAIVKVIIDLDSSLAFVQNADTNAYLEGRFNDIENAKGKAGGFASLDDKGKVPADQLPSMDYIPTQEKGKAGGVPTLGEDGLVPVEQLPELGSTNLYGTTELTAGTSPLADGVIYCMYE